jgi:hypothetical protein
MYEHKRERKQRRARDVQNAMAVTRRPSDLGGGARRIDPGGDLNLWTPYRDALLRGMDRHRFLRNVRDLLAHVWSSAAMHSATLYFIHSVTACFWNWSA